MQQMNSSSDYNKPVQPAAKRALAVVAMRFAFKIGGVLAPRLTARLAHRLWFRPQRHTPPAREQNLIATAEHHPVRLGKHQLSVYSWGRGKTVLLVHGWSGRGAQLGEFVAPLVSAGYRVVTFDAPAHGRSSGHETTLLEISDAILSVARNAAPIHAVIAHSFGVTCALYALRERRFAQRMIAISAPASMDGVVETFADQLSLSPRTVSAFRDKITARFGTEAWTRFSTQSIASDVNVPALLIHDRDDVDVPVRDSAHIAAAWPDARLMLTQGLGHRRILRDPSVITEAVRFIGPAQQAMPNPHSALVIE